MDTHYLLFLEVHIKRLDNRDNHSMIVFRVGLSSHSHQLYMCFMFQMYYLSVAWFIRVAFKLQVSLSYVLFKPPCLIIIPPPPPVFR